MVDLCYVGCSGWSLPKTVKNLFPPGSSLLERYSRVFPAVEINSTFYRSHRIETYCRWADSVPESFRFSVKAPRMITHKRRLLEIKDSLTRFIEETSALGAKLGAYLFQFPPSLPYYIERVEAFYAVLRGLTPVPVVIEPRHPSWFSDKAESLAQIFGISRAGVDPAPVPSGSVPGGDKRFVYFRWHGSPVKYVSSYTHKRLVSFAQTVHDTISDEIWCIFDNTAAGAAVENGMSLMELLGIRG